MQLVLGAQGKLGVGSAGAQLPAPPERWRLSERARRVLRRIAWVLAFLTLAALGALHGASVAIGADGVSEIASGAPAAPAATTEAQRERELRGTFWKPESSTAERPVSAVEPRRWRPEAR
jgi:hypothetical protein